jgi:hypothetical protein
MMTLFAVLMHRLLPSRHPAPDTTGLQECVDALWEQHVPLAPRAVLE